MKKGLTLAIGLLFTILVQAQNIDTQKSIVNFTVSNMKWKIVEGTFTGMKGDVNFNETDLSNASCNVCINAASINTANEKRDNHLRNADFFDVEKYSDICFTSISVSKINDGFIAKGKLIMHGVTKDESINFTYENGEFRGKLSINRFDYKVGEDTGTFMVGDVVDIEIIAVVK